jgi:hypothetical protein
VDLVMPVTAAGTALFPAGSVLLQRSQRKDKGFAMHDFHGDLLIGGMTLHDLHGDLEQESLAANSHDWLLAGHILVPKQQVDQLVLRRLYLLKLEDGREGLVELTRLAPGNGQLLADFQPHPRESH